MKITKTIKKSVCTLSVSILVVLLIVSVGTAFAKDKIKLNFAHHSAAGTGNDLDSKAFISALTEMVGDKVEVKYFPGGQIGDQRELIEQVKLGSLEMCLANPPLLSNMIPKFGVMDLPYMLDSLDHIERVVGGRLGFIFKRDLIKKEGLRILTFLHVGFRDMLTKKKLFTKTDFAGVKFRSPQAPVYVNMFKSIGATPVPLPWGETYTALQTNLIEGMETPPIYMYSTKMYEQAKYVLKTRHINTVETPIINEAFFNKLPTEVRLAIEQAWREATARNRKRAEQEPKEAYKKLKSVGMEIVEVDRDSLREACQPMYKVLVTKTPEATQLITLIDSAR